MCVCTYMHKNMLSSLSAPLLSPPPSLLFLHLSVPHTSPLLRLPTPPSLHPPPPPKACADKLRKEMEQFGFPPVLPREGIEKEIEESRPDPADPTKRVKKVLLGGLHVDR